jgi:hypothetical protein
MLGESWPGRAFGRDAPSLERDNGHWSCCSECMTQNTVNPAPHAGEKDTSGVHTGKPVKPSPDDADDAKDATSTASKPQGTLQDQIKTMESEGQAQPQSDEVPPEERPKGKGARR